MRLLVVPHWQVAGMQVFILVGLASVRILADYLHGVMLSYILMMALRFYTEPVTVDRPLFF